MASELNFNRETVAEHRQAAFRFGFCRLVLQDVPVFGETAVLDPDHVRGNPGDGPTIAREAAVDDDVVAFREDELMLVTQGIGQTLDQIEQTVTARFDVRAMLDVGFRPKAAGRIVVALVEQGVEGFQDCFVPGWSWQ
jgi:hypothetical protein